MPDAKYLILNVSNSIALSPEELVLFKSTDPVMDTSGRNMMNLSEMIVKFGKEKFAFGTHSPVLDYRTGLLRVESLS